MCLGKHTKTPLRGNADSLSCELFKYYTNYLSGYKVTLGLLPLEIKRKHYKTFFSQKI